MHFLKFVSAVILGGAVLSLSSCNHESEGENPTTFDAPRISGASEQTRAHHQSIRSSLPFNDREDFDLATRGLTESTPNLTLTNTAGNIIWTTAQYGFLNEDNAETVNPSLWRHAQLAYQTGLFEVQEHIYQIRGFDAAIMTIVEAPEGLIIIDPLASKEQSSAAFELYLKHRSVKPIKAVIYTHPHIDHYGGVEGLISREDVNRGDVQIIAPEGFMESLVSEWAIAGTTMGRRGMYQFGVFLPRSPEGHVDSGMGKSTGSGTTSVIAPTYSVSKPIENLNIAGLETEFLLTPGTEAPVEFAIFFPELSALCTAELATASLHNLLTLRGAKVRDARQWVYYLRRMIDLYGAQTEVAFNTHHWPRWGNKEVLEYLESTADSYQFIHDQTLRLAAKGLTMDDIANTLEMPKSLQDTWYVRGYYGTVSVGARAVYQNYFGFFDGNPANLEPLSRVDNAKRTIEYMGGRDNVLKRARKDFDQGNYSWVAKVLNHLVFADSEDEQAREFLAETYEQLAYQAESAIYRNFYLTGAQELRAGVPNFPIPPSIKAYTNEMTIPQLFETMAVRLDPNKVEGKEIIINFILDDGRNDHFVRIKNSVLSSYEGRAKDPYLDVYMSRKTLENLLTGVVQLDEGIENSSIRVEGSSEILSELFSMLDPYNIWFPIVTPVAQP